MPRAGGNQAFSFIGDHAFGAAGQVRFEKHGSDTLVLLNADSDKAAEMAIVLKGHVVPTASDFHL